MFEDHPPVRTVHFANNEEDESKPLGTRHHSNIEEGSEKAFDIIQQEYEIDWRKPIGQGTYGDVFKVGFRLCRLRYSILRLCLEKVMFIIISKIRHLQLK